MVTKKEQTIRTIVGFILIVVAFGIMSSLGLLKSLLVGTLFLISIWVQWHPYIKYEKPQ